MDAFMLSDDSNMAKEVKVKNDSIKSSDSSETGNEKRKKKGKSAAAKTVESIPDDEDYVPTKSKKNQRKGKGASSLQASDTKAGAKKDTARMQENDNLNVPTEEWIMQKILTLNPDFEEQGKAAVIMFHKITTLTILDYFFYCHIGLIWQV